MLPKQNDYYVSSTTKNNTDEVLPVISKSVTKYANKFNQIHLTEDRPFAMFESVRNQNYDQLIVAKFANSANEDDCFVIFIDEKSTDVFIENEEDSENTHKLDGWQFSQVQEVVNRLKIMQDEGVTLSPASLAMVNGRYRFIYLTTHEKMKKTEYIKQNKENLIVMERKEAETFFGFVFDFYQSARVALQARKEIEKIGSSGAEESK